MRKLLVAVAAAGFFSAGASTSAMAEWPEREITLVVPFSPGGGVDQLMLPLKPLLEERLGVPVLLDYRGGASGQIGYQAVHARGDDGYTIAALVLPHLVGTFLYQEPTYTPDDFAPVAIISGDVPIWFAHKDAPFDDINDLIAAAREQPGELTVAIGSFTGEHYVTLVQLEDQAEISFRAVNVGGGSEVMSGVAGGHFDVGISRPASIAGVIDDIKGLGLVASDRHGLFPDTMTFAEQLDDAYDIAEMAFAVGVTTTVGFAERDPAAFARLAEAVRDAVHSDAYRASLEQGGRDLTYLDPDAAKRLVDEMTAVMERYQPLVEAAQQ